MQDPHAGAVPLDARPSGDGPAQVPERAPDGGGGCEGGGLRGAVQGAGSDGSSARVQPGAVRRWCGVVWCGVSRRNIKRPRSICVFVKNVFLNWCFRRCLELVRGGGGGVHYLVVVGVFAFVETARKSPLVPVVGM